MIIIVRNSEFNNDIIFIYLIKFTDYKLNCALHIQFNVNFVLYNFE